MPMENTHPVEISNSERSLTLGQTQVSVGLSNRINNQKYTAANFVPVVLFNQFKYFFNLFFLILAISQFVPALKVGILFSYVAPLAFVLTLTLLKEGVDDLGRKKRDLAVNRCPYEVWLNSGLGSKAAEDLKVGDILRLRAGQKIPADCILLWTSDQSESVFIKTDQLDGETDWKVRLPVNQTQKVFGQTQNARDLQGKIRFEAPSNLIYDFKGGYQHDQGSQSLDLQQTLWQTCVLCSAEALAVVIYIGPETRIRQNIKEGREKVG